MITTLIAFAAGYLACLLSRAVLARGFRPIGRRWNRFTYRAWQAFLPVRSRVLWRIPVLGALA